MAYGPRLMAYGPRLTEQMRTPLDREIKNRVGLVKLARIYSNVVSPPVMFAILGLLIAMTELPDWRGLVWAAVYGFTVSLLPILFVLYLLRNGTISELHMTNTRERYLPYVLAICCAALAFALISIFQGPRLLRCLALFNVVELTALGLINLVSLISLHSTGIMATMVIIGLIYGWGYSLFVLPLVISVCWVRLYLKRHTPGQVGAGLVLGVLSVFSLTLVGCFSP